MTRREMIDELLERLEGELDELSNPQLTSVLSEYEHAPMLTSIIEDLNLDTDLDSDQEDDEEEDEEELPLIDGDWDETEEETEE